MTEHSLENFVIGSNKDRALDFLKEIMKSDLNICITGPMSSGKTTLMKSLLEYSDAERNIRVLDPITELELKAKYPTKNIYPYTEEIKFGSSSDTLVDVFKNIDGFISVLDELDSDKVLNYYLAMTVVSNSSSMLTHYSSSTEALVNSLTEIIVSKGFLDDYESAKKMVLTNLKLNIHLNKTIEGKIYLERISGVMPTFGNNTYFNKGKVDFRVKDLLKYDSSKDKYSFLSTLDYISESPEII